MAHNRRTSRLIAASLAVAAFVTSPASAESLSLDSPSLRVQVEARGRWSLVDKASGVRWPTEGTGNVGWGRGLDGQFREVKARGAGLRLSGAGDVTVDFELADGGRSLAIRYAGKELDEVHALEDTLAVTGAEQGGIVVPCREGLWIPANSKVAFRRTFGTSDYEGCHMNMLGFVKRGSALVVSWDDAYVFPEVKSTVGPAAQRITVRLALRRSARQLRLTPLGRGDWNTIAAGYRRIAGEKGLAVTLAEKIRRNAHAERMLGAANVKLWTCLARRMNDESTKEESVKVRWTFDEAAQIAEHLRRDLKIDRCLFILGGWTEGGYDCRHPDNLPANPECGGNRALADAVRRIQAAGYVACLHDNYQDMYRDAKSWNPDCIEKRPDGSLIQGGRWLGGRAFMVCAPKQVELAMRPQNLPEIQRQFGPWSYFIDTTYAVGPRECADPKHPIGRNEDIAFKIRLSQKSRELFGLFGSECGREWALPHSDFFEGLVGVSGRCFHNLKPESLGARVIPFWEMVYHDCQVCYGKYGYPAEQSAEYVAHHVLCARPLNYHSIPDHLYWKEPAAKATLGDRGCFARTDQGWAAGMHPVDAFLKNTQEVLGPLHLATAHQRLTSLEFLTPAGPLRRAVYGEGDEATHVLVNLSPADAAVQSAAGGQTLLPPWGFVIEGPKLAAFYAKRWSGRDYPRGALFTVQPADGKDLRRAERVRVFHGFGEPEIVWKGRTHKVAREEVVSAETRKKVLYFTRSVGYEHSPVHRDGARPSVSERALVELGKRAGFEVECSKDGGVFDGDLGGYDLFAFYTCGDLTQPGKDPGRPMTPAGKRRLLEAIAGGKGFVGFHSAADTFHSPGARAEIQTERDPYVAMLGGEFITQGAQQEASLVLTSRFPVVRGIGCAEGMSFTDEWYALKNFAPDLHVVLVQETRLMKGDCYRRPDFPCTWARMHGRGRVFYTSLGHREDIWTNPFFQAIVLGGFSWALGDAQADVKPNIDQVTPQANQLKP